MNIVTNINKSNVVKGLPYVEVPVYEIIEDRPQYSGRKRKIYGVARFHTEPRIIECRIPHPQSSKELEKIIKVIAEKVGEIKPGMKLCPTHSNWMKFLSDNYIKIDLLFAMSGEDAANTSRNYSRRNQLDYHLKDQSRHLGKLNIKVIRGNSFISDDDGVIYIKSGTLKDEPKYNPQKVICYADFSASQLKKQSPVIKGMAVMIPADKWRDFCKKLNIDSSINAVVPEITIKYDDNQENINCEVFSVFNTVISRKVSFSIQAAERVPLTPYGEKIIQATYRERIREVMEAYNDPTGLTVAEYINQEFRKLRRKSDYDEDVFFIENAETLGATYAALISGLPMNDSEYLNSTLSVLLEGRVKTISLPGLTIPVIPGRLKPFEIIMPYIEARRLGIKRGDRVTISRYPNTGIEMAEVTIIGFTHFSSILIDPHWWAERFSGDFDGDLIGLMPISGIIDENRINNAVSPKQKGKGEMTIAEAIARSYYAKMLIPQADMLATICMEHGKDLSYIRSILQNCIDGIKHSVSFPNISLIKAFLGLENYIQPSPISMLIRGKLGHTKKEVALRYGALVGELSTRSGISWIQELAQDFRLIISSNRKYAEQAYEGSSLIDRYTAALTQYKQHDLINLKRNRERSPIFPKVLLEPYLNGAIKEVERIRTEHPDSVLIAYECYEVYQKWMELLRIDKPELAFKLLKNIRQKVTEEHSGIALRYLFICMAYQAYGIDPVFKIKSLKILSYFPMIHGEYNLPQYIKALKYTRMFDIRIS